jgi:pimeloyl-ACP methyl ester carboxylesterase
MQNELEHQVVRINGIQLHVVTAGKKEGPLILFLHGFPEYWVSWKRQIEHFASLGYRVLAPDQRGYNLSDKPLGIQSYNIDQLAADVVGLIAWAGRERAVIAGHDWGAAVAWWTALKYPEKIEKLVICNVPHPLVMKKNLSSNWAQMKRSWYIFFFQIPFLPEKFLARDRFQRLMFSLQKTSLPGTFSTQDLEGYREAWQRPGALTAMVNWYRAALRNVPATLQSYLILVPTLIVWGERDKFLGKEMAAQSLDLCKNGRLELIPEATHWVHHEKPQRVSQLIESFLSEKVQ